MTINIDFNKLDDILNKISEELFDNKCSLSKYNKLLKEIKTKIIELKSTLNNEQLEIVNTKISCILAIVELELYKMVPQSLNYKFINDLTIDKICEDLINILVSDYVLPFEMFITCRDALTNINADSLTNALIALNEYKSTYKLSCFMLFSELFNGRCSKYIRKTSITKIQNLLDSITSYYETESNIILLFQNENLCKPLFGIRD